MDIALAVMGLLLLSPLALVLALLIKCTSPGPVFFAQQRVGRHGKTFLMYKFRTMYRDAEQQLAQNPQLLEWDGPIFRVRHDPRITPLGKFLRRFGLDELPQLLHVLLGQMSIVGPRPHLLVEASNYEPWHTESLICRPGLTCLWQIGDRHNVSFDDWIRMDLYYVRHLSILLDLRIMLATVPAQLFGKSFHLVDLDVEQP